MTRGTSRDRMHRGDGFGQPSNAREILGAIGALRRASLAPRTSLIFWTAAVRSGAHPHSYEPSLSEAPSAQRSSHNEIHCSKALNGSSPAELSHEGIRTFSYTDSICIFIPFL